MAKSGVTIDPETLIARFSEGLASRTSAVPGAEPLGVPWFRRQDYAHCLDVMDDRDRLPPTFEAWEAEAQRRFAELQAFGCTLERVTVDPDDFVSFCRVEGLRHDGMALKAFAAVMLARQANRQ